MIDPLTPLSFAVQSNPGVYALLLGSGVSRSAEIPTGWGVTMDLTQKLAAAEKKDASGDPAAWYREHVGGEPDYSKLLDTLAKTPAERQQLLRRYFEPAADAEQDDGAKRPTPAHRAVARLVKGGFVRIVVTTNFDQLIEQALRDEGVTPSVVSTPDQVDGMEPLAHQRCLVVKLHGDYLDTRIKNTAEELDSYDPRMEQLTRRIFDEFGMIVCGWSAEWDTALCRIIESVPSRRYTFYWASRGEPGERAARLVEHRAGVVLPIEGADEFFPALADRVRAIEDAGTEHPMTVRAVEAAAKRYVTRVEDRVRLHELVTGLTEEVVQRVAGRASRYYERQGVRREEKERDFVQGCFEDQAALRAACFPVARWGNPSSIDALVKSLERLADGPNAESGVAIPTDLQHVGCLHLLYSLGVAALAERRFPVLMHILQAPASLDVHTGEQRPLLRKIAWGDAHSLFEAVWGKQRWFYPLSEWYFAECRADLARIIPSQQKYEAIFDLFEAVRSLAYLDLGHKKGFEEEGGGFAYWVPGSRFMVKLASIRGYGVNVVEQLRKEDIRDPLLAAGMCCGDGHRYDLAVQRLGETAARHASKHS